jgi:2,3-bisphosphoglycerate-independent phosphoglycerate mutase
MKYVILHAEGVAGLPSPELDGRTPLEAAMTPNLDRLAGAGELGMLVLPADEFGAGGVRTQLALLGYDPRKHPRGYGPFEAAGLGVGLGEHDVAYRCSMVTLRAPASAPGAPASLEVKKLSPQALMDDPEAGGIETEEARDLIDAVNEQLGSESLQFYPGEGHRHLMVWVDGKARAVCVDPGRVAGRPIGEALPSGDGADILKQVMEAALIILRDHPVNEERRRAGKKPANCLWLWGQGRAPTMTKVTDRYQLGGSVVAKSGLHRGIGISAGLDPVAPPGPAETSGAAEAALRGLEKKDFAYVHVDVPGEVARGADLKSAILAIEEFDRTVVGPLTEGLLRVGPHRLLVIGDQTASGGSGAGPVPTVPCVLYQGPTAEASSRRFTEAQAAATNVVLGEATRLLPKLLGRG